MKTTPLIRLVILFASIPVAFLVAELLHSRVAFLVVMAAGLVLRVVLRSADYAERQADGDDQALAEQRERLRRLTNPKEDARPA